MLVLSTESRQESRFTATQNIWAQINRRSADHSRIDQLTLKRVSNMSFMNVFFLPEAELSQWDRISLTPGQKTKGFMLKTLILVGMFEVLLHTR